MRNTDEPHVGIFWHIHRRIIIDSTPMGEAERYGDCLTHPRGHLDCWTEFQRQRLVPDRVEYEEPPRGRVLFDKERARFVLLADACILRRSTLVQQIMKRMHLPPEKTDVDRDDHYRCAMCLARSRSREL